MAKVKKTKTISCRSEEGITIGLIDSIISISRILAKRDLSSYNVIEALKDLRDDEDVDVVTGYGAAGKVILRAAARLKEMDAEGKGGLSSK